MMNDDDLRRELASVGDSAALLVAVLSRAPCAVQLFNARGHSLYVNTTFRTLFGAAAPPDAYNLLTDPQTEPVRAELGRAFAGEAVTLPLVWYDPKVHVEAHLMPLFGADGAQTHVLLLAADRTRERRAVERLEAVLDAIATPVVITTWDRVTFANRAARAMLGTPLPPREHYGRFPALRPDGTQYSLEERPLARALRGETVPGEEAIVEVGGGAVRHVVTSAAPLASVGLRVTEAVASFFDITALRQREAELRASEHRFRALVENSSDVTQLVSAETTVIYTSPSTERILGWPTARIVGTSCFSMIHPEDLAAARRSFESALARPGEAVTSEFRLQHADGAWRIMEAIEVNHLDDPALGFIVKNLRDISDRKHLEEQFRQSQKMEAVGRLAGGIAHDFNNMLSAILGFASLIEHGLAPDSPIRDDVQEVIRASERASGLTRQLLMFSRKQVVLPRVLDLSVQVRDFESMLRRVIGDDIELVTRLAPGRCPIRIDPSQLEQVLLNLVVNARDAMPRGGTLTLETQEVELDRDYSRANVGVTPGRYVALAVTDTGEGIPSGLLPHIWEPFFTTKGGRGTGLGLSTVFGIVTQAGGHLTVTSEVGLTTRFVVYFPYCVEPAPAGAGPPERTDALGGRETILLVEDELVVRQFVLRVLSRAGYQVVEAAHGEEALRLAGQYAGPIHLLLTDLVMPRMSGRALAERLLADRPGTAVVYMSGYAADVFEEGEVGAGLYFLAKPMTPDRLLETVRQALGAGRA